MQYTLLEMTQRILAAMDSDEVNSITDTAESVQVALLIEGVYYDLVAECNLPSVGTLFELTASGDNTKPTLMTIPAEVLSLEWVMYNKIESGETFANFQEIKYREVKDFMSFINTNRELDATLVTAFTHTVTTSGGTHAIQFLCRKDAQPTWYTSFDDGTLIFDSYDSTLDTTLQKAKTQCWGSVAPSFTQQDGFTPSLNVAQFSLLMNEAKTRAFIELKQMQNTNAQDHARRGRIRLRNSKRKTPREQPYPLSTLPNYGRK